MNGRSRSPIPGLKELLLPLRGGQVPGGAATRLARALFRSPDTAARPDALSEVLRRVALFEDLDRHELRRLARIVHEREYRDGEYICEEGAPGTAMFVLRSGTVEVLRRAEDGQPVSLAVLEPPASFEESAATGIDAVRRFSVRARGAVSLLALGKSDLDAMIVNFPVLANKVLLRLAGVMAMRLRFVLDAYERPVSDTAPETER